MDILRPSDWDTFIGNSNNVELVKESLEAALIKIGHMPHVLLSGPPGTGKTTIANIIRNKLDKIMFLNFQDTSGSLLDNVKSIEEIVEEFKDNNGVNYNLVFIDEVDIIEKKAEKTLLTILEDFKFKDRVVPKFTMIAACNDPGKISSAFIRRFPLRLSMDEYSDQEMYLLIRMNIIKLEIEMDENTVLFILSRSRNNPSFVNNILTTLKDHKIAKSGIPNDGIISLEDVKLICDRLGIDSLGLLKDERIIIDYLKFVSRPIGAKIICSACQLELDTYLNVYEPYLIRKRLIAVTNKGRVIV